MRLATAALCLVLPVAGAIPPLPEGFHALYNLDYARAIGLFEQETAQRPEDPEAWNHLAHAILHRALFDAGAFDSAAFAADNSFLRRPKVPMRPEDLARFEHAINRSLALCGERLKQNGRDAACLYAIGVAHGHKAQLALWVRKAWLEALREGTKSREAHERLLRLEPDLADARLIPGLHEYVAGSLPWYIKGLAFLAGFRGDRRHGMEQMERAAAEGKKTAVEARVMLAVVYRREKQFGKAAALMRELAEAFPKNHLYRIEEIRLLAGAGRASEARERLEALEQSGLVPPDKIEELARAVDRIAGRRTP